MARSGRHRPALVYGAHKWWARRPAPSIRALLLAAAFGEGHENAFWAAFRDDSNQTWRDGRVGDPFTGGGTSLVEAQRLGAAVYGVDVDPLAVLITEHELEHLDAEEFRAAAVGLQRHLRERCADLYASSCDSETPLHYFYVRRVTCTHCDEADLLYKNLVLARDVGRAGAVVRDDAVHAFCPFCLELHALDASRKTLNCCGRWTKLRRATFVAGRYECRCGARLPHDQLGTGVSPRVLLAVEVTTTDGRRKIRKPTLAEVQVEILASERLATWEAELVLPRKALSGTLKQRKPGMYGFASYDELFSSRQLLLFGSAFHWLRDQLLSRRVKTAIALAVSNALSSNNQLCGYATDYGRLSPLFSIRDYSMPTLSVELNPLHETAGRGTLTAMLRRVELSKSGSAIVPRDSSVRVADSAHVVWPDTGGLDLILTDPPYFDYIAYSDLSSFFRAWLGAADLIEAMPSGRPLFETASSRTEFAERLGQSFDQARQRLRPGGLMAFTYHASSADGWRAMAEGIASGGFSLTAAFPLWADGQSPGHGHAGNLEYDLVLCCRPAATHAWMSQSSKAWREMLPTDKVREPDLTAWKVAAAELNKFVS